MSARWFVLINGEVIGPFDEIGTQDQLALHPQALVWGKGQAEWLNQNQWRKFMSQYEEAVEREKTHVDRGWRVKVGEQEHRPMVYDQMILFLRQLPDLSNARIWTEGYGDWKEVYQIHKILDDLGISRRAHPRVPIMGDIELDGAAGQLNGRLLSVSEGGLGVMVPPTSKLGDKFRAVLKSPNLTGPVHCSVEVVFTEPNGYTGMKFISLHTELKNLIIEYVKKFSGERA